MAVSLRPLRSTMVMFARIHGAAHSSSRMRCSTTSADFSRAMISSSGPNRSVNTDRPRQRHVSSCAPMGTITVASLG